jgi:hypothetical protein
MMGFTLALHITVAQHTLIRRAAQHFTDDV